MAEESKNVSNEEVYVEATDRGLFDFMGKKEEKPVEEEKIISEMENVHVSEPEKPKVEEEKKEGILEKLHRTSSSSSCSSSDEEKEEGETKKKKKRVMDELKEKIPEDMSLEEIPTSVPIKKYEEPAAPEEKKGIVEKMKEKLSGQHKNSEEVPPPAPAEVFYGDSEEKTEKKGIVEKIKEKLPGYHPKSEEEKET